MGKQDGPGVYRITGARTSLSDDVRGRQRRYIISMSIRTVSVILTVVLWNVERPLAWATLVLGALLPYVAVVIANAGRENRPPAMPTVVIPPPVRPALEASRVETTSERARAAGHSGAEQAGSGRADDGQAHDAYREAGPAGAEHPEAERSV
ncbi:Protein of unknown function [Actinacidiphila rubida]|uniref:DUF3099 domain-containing protein n=2 Tax=Actinacidiphila rubida TaxID=310780 RepID=A0A1H8S9H3_9ACTN|nr:DUF3099 domain-containing protein [Actinacidiphila rubida]SEO75311.1 Protein of unknown function [Actinacidiphila rubida]